MNSQKWIGFILATTLLCIPAVTAWAQGQSVSDLEQRGRTALEKGDYSAASQLFSDGSSRAEDPETRARLDFRQAVSLQQMAANSTVIDQEEVLKRAAGLYRNYLYVHPESAAASNNLAKTYEQMGDILLQGPEPVQARRYFIAAAKSYKKAVAADDSRQGLYLKNYAELLEKAGEWDRARKVYEQLIREHPVARKQLQSMTDSYASRGLEELAGLTWLLLDAGYARQAIDIAMNAVRDSRNEADDGRVELLAVVSAGLAEGTDDYSAFLESETGLAMQGLSVDDFLGEGAAGVVLLYEASDFEPQRYRWWGRRGSPNEDPERGLWPADSFQALARSLGSRAKRKGDLDLAEKYFVLAAELQPWVIDPVSIRALALMYAEKNDFQRVNALLDRYKVRLFESKGRAYRESSVEKIFQYHQTLGELYTLIERWGDSSQADSAIFQLEHAREKSIMLEDDSPRPLPEKYQFTPQMVDSLSKGYERTQQPVKGTELRIEQAERYQRAGDTKAAKRVLTPVKAAEVPSTLETRYQNLRVNPELIAPNRNLDLQRASIKEKGDSGL